MSEVFFYEEFNDHDLDNGKTPLREKFNAIIEDLEENKYTNLGGTKLIKGDGDVKYFRAKLSDSDRLLFTSIKHNNEDAFVILEVILNHDYQKSKFLQNKEKIKTIKIIYQNSKEVSDTVEIEVTPQVRWLGKFITLNGTQEDIVKDAEDLPLIVSGSAGSGKTSVALEKFRKIEEKFEEGKVLYITQSENLIKQSKELYEYVYWDETTNDFKIGIPDRIEFLSLHEFLEKKAEDIKGKKPIDRNKFFSWFNEICKKDKFKEYKKDGDKIFEEFTAVIAGGSLKRKQYKELGKRQAIFSEEERDNIYSLFAKYKEFIEKDSEYYDPNLIANECTEEKIYDAIVVDEVQDLTESTLSLILKSLKDESKDNFLLCGDVNQVIHPSFFSLSKLKSSLHKNAVDKEPSVCFLEKNYRNSQQVIELANRVLHLKNYCFASEDKMTAGEKEAFFMNSDTENIGNVNFIADDKKEEIAKKVSKSTNWAVLVLDDESKENARKSFNTPLVFNIHEAKGLEYKNVVLYEFVSHGAYNGVWNIAKDKTDEKKVEDAINEIRDLYNKKSVNPSRRKDSKDKSFEEFKFYMNALYVGVSRAIDCVYIIGNERKCNLLKVIKSEEKRTVNMEDIKKEESTLEAWRNEALRLIGEGKIEQAKGIVATKLSNKKEYAEEITKKLEAKEYHKEQASSELKTENRASQESSTSESRTPKSKEIQDKKRKQHPKEKKKLEELEKKNTEELFSALKNDDLSNAKKLIEQEEFKVNVNARDNENCTLLYYAAENGHTDIVQFLLQHKAEVHAARNATSLHLAAQNGHKDVIELLLQHEADVNVKAEKDRTPLHLAAQNGHKDVVELLLQHRAVVDAKDDFDYTPLHSAAQNGHKDVVELLLQHRAVVDAKDDLDYTPLHLAAQEGKEDVAKLLLKNGAVVNAKTNDNCTPLHLAAQNGHKNIVELLLKHRAELNAKNSDNYTPLHLAAQEGKEDVAKLLLQHEADVNVKAEKDRTPLHSAAQNGHFCVAQLLLQRNDIIVNAEAGGNFTSLHVAVINGHENIVELLLKHGAVVDAKNEKGYTPLHLAAQNGHKNIAGLLLKHEADVNAKTNDNYTPLDLAMHKDDKGHRDVIKLLLDKGAVFFDEDAQEKPKSQLSHNTISSLKHVSKGVR